MLAGIHFQYITDDGKIMERILSSRKPFAAFIPPVLLDRNLKTEDGHEISGRVYPEENYYPEWFIDVLRKNKFNPNITWVQEGYVHYCGRCFEKFLENGGREKDASPDPFHEHVCLDGHAQSIGEQSRAIDMGRTLIRKVTGIRPTGYCAPNHLFNDDTLRAVREAGFLYFVPRNLAFLPAYSDEGLIVLPEAKLGERRHSPVISTYYDHLVDGKWDKFYPALENSSNRHNRPVGKIALWTGLNSFLVCQAKKARDRRRAKIEK